MSNKNNNKNQSTATLPLGQEPAVEKIVEIPTKETKVIEPESGSEGEITKSETEEVVKTEESTEKIETPAEKSDVVEPKSDSEGKITKSETEEVVKTEESTEKIETPAEKSDVVEPKSDSEEDETNSELETEEVAEEDEITAKAKQLMRDYSLPTIFRTEEGAWFSKLELATANTKSEDKIQTFNLK